MARELFAQTTGAATSAAFNVLPNETVTVSVIGTLGASDVINIQYSPNGTDWYNLKENTAERNLDTDNNVQLIRGPIRARVDKGAATANVGCALHTRSTP